MGFKCMRPSRLFASLVVLAALGGGVQQVRADDDAEDAAEKVREEAEVLGVIRALHQAEIDYASAARERLQDPEVRTFCEMLIMDHRAALGKIDDVAGAAGVTPIESDEARDVAKDVPKFIEDLGEEEVGKDYDNKFLDKEKDLHDEALDKIDDLLESTTRPEFAQMLADMRGTVVAHQDRIKSLKDRLDDKDD